MRTLIPACIFCLATLFACKNPPPQKVALQPAQPVSYSPRTDSMISLTEVSSTQPPYSIRLYSRPDFIEKKELLPQPLQRKIDEITQSKVREAELNFRKEKSEEFIALECELILPPAPCLAITPVILRSGLKRGKGKMEANTDWYNIDKSSGSILKWDDIWLEEEGLWKTAAITVKRDLARNHQIEADPGEAAVKAAIGHKKQFLLSSELWMLVNPEDIHPNLPREFPYSISIPYHKISGLKFNCD